MNKLSCLILFLITYGICKAQINLVPNPSFEIYDTCPYHTNQIHFAEPWLNANSATPDYFNACDTIHNLGVPVNYVGNQLARTGVAYIGLVTAFSPINHVMTNYREYIEIELTDSLVAGVDYCVKWYVSACDSCHYISNNMGMYFSSVLILDTLSFHFINTPQIENQTSNNLNDRIGWTEISGTYTAAGGEKFIIIGNFHDSISTVITYTGWSYPNNSLYDLAYYYIDDVQVALCNTNTGFHENKINNQEFFFPNPFTDKLTITINTGEKFEVSLYDVTSRMFFNQSFTNSTSINTEQFAKGIYIYEVRNKNGVIKKGKIVKY